MTYPKNTHSWEIETKPNKPQTNTPKKETSPTLNTIKKLVNQLKPKCICGTTLKGENLNHYPHPNGINLNEYNEPQWIYVTCTKCSYDMSLAKILRQNQHQTQHTNQRKPKQ